MSRTCVSCGEGEHRLCADCNKGLRQENRCPLCLSPVVVRREGRRVVRVHPAVPCPIWAAGPWFYHGKPEPYLVPADAVPIVTVDGGGLA
jgi:hypothetical protein